MGRPCLRPARLLVPRRRPPSTFQLEFQKWQLPTLRPRELLWMSFHVVSLPGLFPEHEGHGCSLARLRCASGLRNCLRAGALTGVTDPLITAGYPRGFTLSLRTSFAYDRCRRIWVIGDHGTGAPSPSHLRSSALAARCRGLSRCFGLDGRRIALAGADVVSQPHANGAAAALAPRRASRGFSPMPVSTRPFGSLSRTP
jgi:hypothetical protein